MDKQEALIEFLKGLRIALSNASAYNKDHPYFIKSAENFKQKISNLFQFIKVIKINFASDALFVEEQRLDKSALYIELASMFHIRKIKSVEIKEGFATEELIEFLSSVSLPIKDILRGGGIQNILNKYKSPHFTVEALDYSQFLGNAGEESKDIWIYLFKQTVMNTDAHEVREFIDNFEASIGKIRLKDLTEDEELRENLYNFLMYLKENENEKFSKCAKILFKLMLRDKNSSAFENIDKIKKFFQDLKVDDFTETVWDEMMHQEDFNFLSLKIFSRLVGEDGHKQIAPSLEKKINESEVLKNNPKIRKRIKELFSMSDEALISNLYRNTLYALTEENSISTGEAFSFNGDLIRPNYRFILLNLLAEEEDQEKMSLISKRIYEECDKVIEERNLDYLKTLLSIIDAKTNKEKSFAGKFSDLEERISKFAENMIFEKEPPKNLEYFIERLKNSALGLDSYIGKIFNEGQVNPSIMGLLLRFFPQDLPRIYENLEKKNYDFDLLEKIVKSMEKVDSPLSLEILKKIFSFANNIIKMEVLNSMQQISGLDEDFLLSILDRNDIPLKKKTLSILIRDENLLKIALDKLFASDKENKIIIDNITVIEDLRIKNARDYLLPFTKKRFFWNKPLREKAQEALEKL